MCFCVLYYRNTFEYELTLRTDLYTNKHTQWFYFRVQNTRKDVTYRFTIVNLLKPKSLYTVGMKPLMYSQLDASTHSIGWRREGNEIRYKIQKIHLKSRDLPGSPGVNTLHCQRPTCHLLWPKD